MARYQVLLDGKPLPDTTESYETFELASWGILRVAKHRGIYDLERLSVAEREIGVSFGTPPTDSR